VDNGGSLIPREGRLGDVAKSRFQREHPSCHLPRSTGELVASGITKDMLRGPRWRRTSRGFYVPSSAPAGCPTQRILDTAPLLGEVHVISGWAAAFVAGVDQLDGRDHLSLAPMPVDVVLTGDLGRASTVHVTYHRGTLAAGEQRRLHGLRVTDAARTILDGASWASDLTEAVALVDACLHAGLLTLPRFRDHLETRHGLDGLPQARAAVILADPATRSSWESRLRVFVVRQADLPRPLVNTPVFDSGGRLLGIPDLLLVDAGVAVEFDGAHHRTPRQHRDDNEREERLESAGLLVVRVAALDLTRHRNSLRARLRDAFSRGLARDRRRDRWTTVEPGWWHDQCDPTACLTDAEKAELFG
jgi:hypothetical protein